MQRFRSLLRLVLPFGAGFVVVCGLFLLPYAVTGSLMKFIHHVVGSTGQRMVELAGKSHAPGWQYLPYGGATVAILAVALFLPQSSKRVTMMVVSVMLIAILACSIWLPGLQDTWYMAGMMAPLVVMFGFWMLHRVRGNTVVEAQTALLLLIVSTCSLVQYPFPYITYFCYFAPLLILAAVACVSLKRPVPGKRLLAIELGFFLCMGCVVVVKHTYNPDQQFARLHRLLSIPRAGSLLVEDQDDQYRTIVPLLQQHASHGLLLAADDCPELYFLSGLQNPLRDDTGFRPADVLSQVRSGNVSVVVLNEAAFFGSNNKFAELQTQLPQWLPDSRRVGKYLVLWR